MADEAAPARAVLGARRVGDRGGRLGVGRAVLVGHDEPEAPVAEVDEVLGHGARAAAIVDVHARAVDVGREVDEDVGQPAGADRLEALVVLGRAEHDVAVDERRAHELRRALGQLRHERQAGALLLAAGGDAGEEEHRGGVVEDVAQPGVEDEPERSGLAAAQRARHRVGAGVAEVARRASTRSRSVGLSWSGRL